ncbi:MAG: transporter permease [Deltaproteobacteria bacterium]|jgi:ABC-2 type transport system permease protein|nr:transporter permease [Deltaproteobacteria bacterium]
MRGFCPVYGKEMYRIFASPIFYVVAFIFLALAGYFFYSAVAYYSLLSFQAGRNPFLGQQLNLGEMVLEPFFGSIGIVLLLMVPLITMRLFAEEKKTGTVELLLTYPISDRGAVLGKFTAALSVVALILTGTLPAMVVLSAFTTPPWATIFSGYLGLVLMSSAFVSLGVLASSLTQNQIVAAAITFGALLLLWIIGWAQTLAGQEVGSVFVYLSLLSHFESFTKGVLDSRDILYYGLFVTIFLFATLRVLESRHWRA